MSKVVSGQEEYFLSAGREDYYLQSEGTRGTWLGRGCALLGLPEHVRPSTLRALFQGRDPRSGSPLGQHQSYAGKRLEVAAFDLTFSAPKSVSILWALSDNAVRKHITAAQRGAVQQTLGYLEDEAAFARRGRGGRGAEPVGLLAAAFEHYTSRGQDPALHTHCLVLNRARRKDGTWGALDGWRLFSHKMAAGALYRAALAHELQERLGLHLDRVGTWFEVRGIDQRLRDVFSSRRAEIKADLLRAGESGSQAAERSALATRRPKTSVAQADLQARWTEAAKEHAFGPQQAGALLHPPRSLTDKKKARSIARGFEAAIRDLTATQSYFPKRDLVRRVAERLQTQGLSADDIRGGVEATLRESGNVLPLGMERAYPVFTTQEVLDTEAQLLAIAARSKRAPMRPVSDRALEKALSKFSHLTEGQCQAVRHIAGRQGGIQCLAGIAGAGKTRSLAAAHEVWRKSGLRVHGCALSARAARELEQATGIPSQTLAKTLRLLDPSPREVLQHHARQLLRAAAGKNTSCLPRLRLGSRDVVVLDEAAMVGTAAMLRLLQAASHARARVILVGDEKQIQPIAAGGPFANLSKSLGRATLNTSTRQREEWEREALLQLRDGDARGALSRYAFAGRLHIESDTHSAAARLIDDWKSARTVHPRETLILSWTKATVAHLNRAAQRARLASNELSDGSCLKTHQRVFHQGDRVLFTRNDRASGVLNGDLGTVQAIRSGGLLSSPALSVRLDRTSPAGAPLDVVVGKRELADLELGYAVTVHKAQGATVESAFVLLDELQDREVSYVELSRARGETHLYASQTAAGEDLLELHKALTRSRAKRLAHDIRSETGVELSS